MAVQQTFTELELLDFFFFLPTLHYPLIQPSGLIFFYIIGKQDSAILTVRIREPESSHPTWKNGDHLQTIVVNLHIFNTSDFTK